MVLDPPMPKARRIEQKIYGKQSFSRVIALLMPALLNELMSIV